MMNIITILNTVIIINWNYRTPRTHNMPKWVRIVFINFLPKVLFMKRPEQPDDENETFDSLKIDTKTIDQEIKIKIKKRHQNKFTNNNNNNNNNNSTELKNENNFLKLIASSNKKNSTSNNYIIDDEKLKQQKLNHEGRHSTQLLSKNI